MAICLINLTTMHGAWCHFCWGNGVIQVEDLKLRCDPHAMAEGQKMKGWNDERWKNVACVVVKCHGKKYRVNTLCVMFWYNLTMNSGCVWNCFFFQLEPGFSGQWWMHFLLRNLATLAGVQKVRGVQMQPDQVLIPGGGYNDFLMFISLI